MATDYRETTLSNLRVERDYYTTKQISEIYHVSQVTVCNWCRQGLLQADKLGQGKSKWRIYPQAIEDIEEHKEELIELSKKHWVRLLVQMRK